MTREEIENGYVYADCPGRTGYAYNADTWCVNCGIFICERLLTQWEKEGKLDTIDHMTLGDTEQFPVPICFEDCDSCSECGAI